LPDSPRRRSESCWRACALPRPALCPFDREARVPVRRTGAALRQSVPPARTGASGGNGCPHAAGRPRPRGARIRVRRPVSPLRQNVREIAERVQVRLRKPFPLRNKPSSMKPGSKAPLYKVMARARFSSRSSRRLRRGRRRAGRPRTRQHR
jgi:hypothetical protein